MEAPFIKRKRSFKDSRGESCRIFDVEDMSMLIPKENYILQVTNKLIGTVRGMHMAEGFNSSPKLVSVLQGEIFDVCVDIRPDSKNFGQIYFGKLSASSGDVLVIPPGFVHGYQTLEANTILVYALDEKHSEFSTKRFRPIDTPLAELWPLAPKALSGADMSSPELSINLISGLPFERV